MKLFPEDESLNYLPYDGEVNYYGVVLSVEEQKHYFEKLMNTVEWRNDEAVVFGKRIVTARKVAWYADERFPYRYSGTTKYALEWTKELLELKGIVENKTGEQFNSCLLNLYHNGNEGMAWHSDAERELAKDGAIGSLSLGVERKFAFKHKATKETINIQLEIGSLLVMKGKTQSNWLHRLPPSKRISNPRVNLTFRQIVKKSNT